MKNWFPLRKDGSLVLLKIKESPFGGGHRPLWQFNTMETSCSLISLGKKDYTPSLHSWYIRWSSPFIRKELCNCHNVSISKLPDPILTCDINSPSCKCPTSCNIVSPKSPPFPKHVLLGESFTVWPFALFLTWIEKKKLAKWGSSCQSNPRYFTGLRASQPSCCSQLINDALDKVSAPN